LNPGDVLIGAFPGADKTKIRPAVVLSTEVYHRHRPDVIVGLITTQSPKELAPTDFLGCFLLRYRSGSTPKWLGVIW